VHSIDTGIVERQLIDPWQAKIAWGMEDNVCWTWGAAAGACDWSCARDKVGGVLWQSDHDGSAVLSWLRGSCVCGSSAASGCWLVSWLAGSSSELLALSAEALLGSSF